MIRTLYSRIAAQFYGLQWRRPNLIGASVDPGMLKKQALLYMFSFKGVLTGSLGRVAEPACQVFLGVSGVYDLPAEAVSINWGGSVWMSL